MSHGRLWIRSSEPLGNAGGASSPRLVRGFILANAPSDGRSSISLEDDLQGGSRADSSVGATMTAMELNPILVPIKRLAHGQGLPLPSYESGQAAGMDLRAA